MISYIKGTVSYMGEGYVILENNNIGFHINTPLSVNYKVNMGQEAVLHTHMAVKEDDISLFGFVSVQDLEMFKLLITVSGIGPKGALAIMSSIDTDELRMAIACEDARLIAKAKGVGTKTAQKLVVELKGKVSGEAPDMFGGSASSAKSDSTQAGFGEALDILEALGFSRTSALKAVNKVQNASELESSVLVSEALKLID
ncbi:MAG: Holliday junction branch migration protein RuvA [Parasporobacterium sp.]|nr:Holliday junction branch migration protein RuvA [Parasporobacterium sp.]